MGRSYAAAGHASTAGNPRRRVPAGTGRSPPLASALRSPPRTERRGMACARTPSRGCVKMERPSGFRAAVLKTQARRIPRPWPAVGFTFPLAARKAAKLTPAPRPADWCCGLWTVPGLLTAKRPAPWKSRPTTAGFPTPPTRPPHLSLVPHDNDNQKAIVLQGGTEARPRTATA